MNQRRLRSCLFLFLILSLGIPRAFPSFDEQKVLKYGALSRDAGDYSGAVSAGLAVVKNNPASTEGYILLASAVMAKQNFRWVVVIALAAERNGIHHPMLYLMKARARYIMLFAQSTQNVVDLLRMHDALMEYENIEMTKPAVR